MKKEENLHQHQRGQSQPGSIPRLCQYDRLSVCHASDRSVEQESQGKKRKVVSLTQVFAKKKINPLSEIGGSKHCRGKGEHVYKAWTTRRVTKRAGVSVPVVTAGK